MSDPKWATDIANKKPKLSWDNLVSTDSFDDTGSATISRQTTGVQTEATYGHTSRKYLWSWTDFAGAIAASKSLLGIPQILQLLKGGKSEMISFADSQKILGGKSRTRIGIKASPLQSVLGKIPFIGPKHAKTIAEFAYWKETQLTYGDRSDVIVGHINRAVIRGDESVVYSGSEEDKSKKKFAAKAIGLPKVEYNEGTTTLTVGASKGYMFATDKCYIVSATQSESGDPNIISFSATDRTILKLESSEDRGSAYIMTDDFSALIKNSSEIISETKTITSNVVNVSCKDSLNLGVSRSTIRITRAKVEIGNLVDLGGPGIEIDDTERESREEQERLEAERQRIEKLKKEMQEFEKKLLEDFGDEALVRG
jgi:hypothetical protein